MEALKVEMSWDKKSEKGTLKIIHQEYIGMKFYGDSDVYVGSSGFKLSSCDFPAYGHYENCLYVRGHDTKLDEQVVTIPTKVIFDKISKTIMEYNKAMDKKKTGVAFEEVRGTFIKNLDDYAMKIIGLILECQDEAVKANSLSELMDVKKGLLLDIVQKCIPTDTYLCPHCIINVNNCANCSYGKSNGECGENYSAFQKIVSARMHLIKTIEDNY